MVAPTAMLWLYAAAMGVSSAISPDGRLPNRAEYVSRAAMALIIAFWVSCDARKRQRELFYDFDSLVFFAWPVVVPVYLFQTRGARAFLTSLCFAGIWLVVMLGAGVIALIRELAA
jgi:hypothetical protein